MIGLGSLCLSSTSLNFCPARINHSRTSTCLPAPHSISNLFHRYNCEDSQEGDLQSRVRHSHWRTMLFCDVKRKGKSLENSAFETTLKTTLVSRFIRRNDTRSTSCAGTHIVMLLPNVCVFLCTVRTLKKHELLASLFLSSFLFLLSFYPLYFCLFISMGCITPS